MLLPVWDEVEQGKAARAGRDAVSANDTTDWPTGVVAWLPAVQIPFAFFVIVHQACLVL